MLFHPSVEPSNALPPKCVHERIAMTRIGSHAPSYTKHPQKPISGAHQPDLRSPFCHCFEHRRTTCTRRPRATRRLPRFHRSPASRFSTPDDGQQRTRPPAQRRRERPPHATQVQARVREVHASDPGGQRERGSLRESVGVFDVDEEVRWPFFELG